MKSKNKKKKLPPNVVIKDHKWYVRRSYKSGLKTKQIWRICHEKTAAAAADVLAEIDEELNIAKEARARKLSKFSEVAARFEKTELVEAVFIKERKVSGLIQTEMPRLFVKNLIKHFGDAAMDKITIADLKEYKNLRLKTPVVKVVNHRIKLTKAEKAKLPPKSRAVYKTIKLKKESQRSIRSVNYELSVLRQIFNFAISNRWLKENPFLREKNLIDTAQENKRNVTWTRDEEKAALALCVGFHAHMKPVIICICDGGFRKNELLSARWSDVDFEMEVMLAKSYKAKTLQIRQIYFTERMKAVLLEWRKLQKKTPEITDRSLVIGYKDIKRSWNTIREKINRPDMTIHDLRHVFATRLAKNVPLADISKLLGHSNLKTTQIYINPDEESLRKAIKTLE